MTLKELIPSAAYGEDVGTSFMESIQSPLHKQQIDNESGGLEWPQISLGHSKSINEFVMQNNQYYLPIETRDMSELTDILLNSLLTDEQHARSTTSREEPAHACALLVYRPQPEASKCSAIGSLQKATQIHIDRLIFGPEVSNYKADLAFLIMSLGHMSLDQSPEHCSHDYH